MTELATFRNERLNRQPSDRVLAKAAGVSPTTVGDWLRAKRFPQRLDSVLLILDMMRAGADRVGLVLDEQEAFLLDERQWRDAFVAEARRRAFGTGEAAEAQQARRALETLRPGWALDEVTNPFDLEVHQPVASGTAGLPKLPAYIRREHDDAVERIAMRAVHGISGLSVLVGGSSTGKTRACWEALAALRDNGSASWRLWHPISPSRPEALVDGLPNCGPYTVIWLNEIQFYLATETDLGERVAAGLRDLLRDASRAPILVLGTLWPEYWDALTRPCRPGENDPHNQARSLLAGADISVPESFSSAELAAIRSGANRDLRVVRAVAESKDGEVTQYLAGVPVLLERYRNAPAPAKALIHAAMDARRLGHGPLLPLPLLRTAVGGYLTDAQWDRLGEGWLEAALAYVGYPCKGVRGPLTRPREEEKNVAPSQGNFQLSDYLDQYGRQTRENHLPPAALWDAIKSHAGSIEYVTCASYAGGRGLYRHAVQFHKLAVHATDGYSVLRLFDAVKRFDPANLENAALWVASNARLGSAAITGLLFRRLESLDAKGPLTAFLQRNPMTHVRLDYASSIETLITYLGFGGADGQLALLLKRNIASKVSVDHPYTVAALLRRLHRLEPAQATSLAHRASLEAPVTNVVGSAKLLEQLHAMGESAACERFLHRICASEPPLDSPAALASLIRALDRIGAEGLLHEVLGCKPVASVQLTHAGGVAALLRDLRLMGRRGVVAQNELSELLDRRPSLQVSLENAYAIGSLIEQFRVLGATGEIDSLLARHPALHVEIRSPHPIAEFIRVLRAYSFDDEVALLVGRNPAAKVSLDFSVRMYSKGLSETLAEIGINVETDEMARLAVAENWIPSGYPRLRGLAERFKYGSEPDLSPARAWDWNEVAGS
ncbi:hypothetical protein ABT299_15870 [Spirillospora sp. NPDC000708]